MALTELNVTTYKKIRMLLVQQRGPTSSRMLETEHGSAEAEESTRQTFPVYGSFGPPVNRRDAETTHFWL